MFDKFTLNDLGLTVVNRGGEEGRVEGIEVHFPSHVVPLCYYSSDLYYGMEKDTEDPDDIMAVKLKSGLVLWERPTVIVRMFSEHIALFNRKDKQLPKEYEGLAGKLVSFKLRAGETEHTILGGALGSCGGIEVAFIDTIPVNLWGRK